MSHARYVRSCQTYSCQGLPPFVDGVTECRACGRERARRCARIVLFGGTDSEHVLIQETLDRAFNSVNYVGLITGTMENFADGTWAIDDATLRLPDDKATPLDARAVLLDVLRQTDKLRIRQLIADPVG